MVFRAVTRGSLVDLLFHMLIPLMLLLIAGLDRRKALMLAPVAIIPDLDVLLVAHRVYLHTIFIPTAAVIICLLLYELKRGELLNFSPPTQEMFLATTYYCSHILLDLFTGVVAIFWPITSLGYGLNVGITVNQYSVIPTIQPYLAVRVKQIPVPNLVTNVAAATPGSIMTAILFVMIMLLTWYKKGRKKQGGL